MQALRNHPQCTMIFAMKFDPVWLLHVVRVESMPMNILYCVCLRLCARLYVTNVLFNLMQCISFICCNAFRVSMQFSACTFVSVLNAMSMCNHSTIETTLAYKYEACNIECSWVCI